MKRNVLLNSAFNGGAPVATGDERTGLSAWGPKKFVEIFRPVRTLIRSDR